MQFKSWRYVPAIICTGKVSADDEVLDMFDLVDVPSADLTIFVPHEPWVMAQFGEGSEETIHLVAREREKPVSLAVAKLLILGATHLLLLKGIEFSSDEQRQEAQRAISDGFVAFDRRRMAALTPSRQEAERRDRILVSWELGVKPYNAIKRRGLAPEQVLAMSLEELEQIPGVGPLLAQEIVDKRQPIPEELSVD